MPSRELAGALAAAAEIAAGGVPLEDRTQLASGEPARFETFVRHALTLAARLVSGTIVLTGSSLEVFGRARTPEDYEALQGLGTAILPEGMTLGIIDIRPSVAEAYVLEIVRAGGGVELIGFMPSADARAEILAESDRIFGAGRTVDRLQIADGAPRMDWIGAAKFALGQAAGLSGGSARISDHSYSITGAAATSETFEEIQTALERTLPASLVLAASLVSAPLASPFRFAVVVGPEVVTIGGVVPSLEVRDMIAAEATARFAPRAVAVEARLASGAPAQFREAALAGIHAMSRLEAGRVEMVDLSVTLAGVVFYAGAVELIEDQLRGALPAGFTVTSSLTVRPADSLVSGASCQELLVAELGETGIQFSEGSAAIAPESEGKLDRLVAILGRCPQARVEIGGYTDSGGTTARNQALSGIRAELVVAYLVGAGVSPARLSAVGYGEANPVASNETEEGRARNRRIEFKILEP